MDSIGRIRGALAGIGESRESRKAVIVRESSDVVKKAFSELSASEQKIALQMRDKGYTICARMGTEGKAFGAPLYFKSADDVGPFLRPFLDYKKVVVLWLIPLTGDLGMDKKNTKSESFRRTMLPGFCG